jgi:transcriptional regulator with XRE-family HTH domain
MGDAPHTPLRQIRLAAGLSLRQVEARTGINRGRLSIIERGVPPTIDEAAAILAALQVEAVPPKVDVA